jgi:hypothetical protein
MATEVPGGEQVGPAAIIADSDSLLAPILIGFRPPKGLDVIGLLWGTAAKSIPKAVIHRKRLQGRKALVTPHVRTVQYTTDTGSSTYRTSAKCGDIYDSNGTPTVNGWEWDVGLCHLNEGCYGGVIPNGHSIVRLDVRSFRLANHGLVAAPQLALFRHLVVERFRALDPRAIVVGGQREWRPEWWSNLGDD